MLDYKIFEELGLPVSSCVIEPTYDVCINDFDIVLVNWEVIEMIAFKFFPIYLAQKQEEFGHKIDPCSEFKRCFTGFLGEAAIEKWLGVKFVDWGVAHSKWFNYADMINIGIDVGIKTCSVPNFPLIYKQSYKQIYRPELINLRVSVNEVLVGGFATVENLRQNVDIKKVKSQNVVKAGKKTAFVGTDKLQYVYSIDELKNMPA